MLSARFRSSLIIIPLLLAVVAIGGPVFAAFIAIVIVLASRELLLLLRSAGYDGMPVLSAAIGVALVVDAFVPAQSTLGWSTVAALGVLAAGAAALSRRDPRDGFRLWLGTAGAGLYGGLLAFMVRLATSAPALHADAPLAVLGPERAWLCLLIGSVWAFDTGAYFTGRAIGRHHFMEHISPKKTVEGVAGGLIATTAVALFGFWAMSQPLWLALIFGPLIALASQAGDLVESMLKRAAGAKDSGSIIPGHGGILDRIDSFLFAAPIAVAFVALFIA